MHLFFLIFLPRSYYSDRGQCAKCYLSCKTCSGPRRDQCVTCPRGWQLAAGECHPECPEGFFKSNFGCQKCHHYCRTCKGIIRLAVAASRVFRIRDFFPPFPVSTFATFRRGTARVHLLSASFDAGGWTVHGVPGCAILRSVDPALQELSLRLSKMHRSWQVQLRRVLVTPALGQAEQPVRALLYRQREGRSGRGVLPL